VTTFALVHGAWHDAWCWHRVTPLLQGAGHDVVAMDLPIDDVAASFDTYADVVCAAIEGCGDDVVLVGHSLAGTIIPLVAARRPVRHLVYLCAYAADIGRSLADQLAAEPEMLNPAAYPGLKNDALSRVTWVDFGLVRELVYADCDDVTVQAAIEHLRPQATRGYAVPCSLAEFPEVSCTSVLCVDDRMLGREWAERVARNRLSADLIELPGSHSPFLSQPSTLADVLIQVAERIT
jgi:pimeloyl-ACP methyl ester carboxylesterase